MLVFDKDRKRENCHKGKRGRGGKPRSKGGWRETPGPLSAGAAPFYGGLDPIMKNNFNEGKREMVIRFRRNTGVLLSPLIRALSSVREAPPRPTR